MSQDYRKALLSIAGGLAAMSLSSPASAGGYDAWLELEGIKGEGAAAHKDHQKPGVWVDILHIRAVERRASAQATGKRRHQPFTARSPYTPAQTGQGHTNHIAGSSDQATAALLLPAVQKVREAAMRMPAWNGCHVGQSIPGVKIRDKSSGKTYRVMDASVAACASEEMSLNFTRIKE